MLQMNRAGELNTEASRRTSEAGFALVSVIWIATLLAVVAALLTASVRATVREAAVARAAAEAEAAADAGLHLALLGLIAPLGAGGGSPSPAPLREFACTLPTGDAVVMRVGDEAGRVDLNIASETLLAALLAGLGFSSDEARARAAAIADWRDGDDDRREGGAERKDYEDRGRPGPRNAPLDAVEELAQIEGFDDALVTRLAPYVTVHSGQDGVDPAFAVPGLAGILDRGWRGSGDIEGSFALANTQGLPPPFVAVSTRRRLRIQSDGVTARGAHFVREAVVSVEPERARSRSRTRGAELPFAIHLWRRGASFAAPLVPTEVLPCES
jgi:general secretion pathway protein K